MGLNASGLCDNLEGCDAVGGGRDTQGRGHMYTYD